MRVRILPGDADVDHPAPIAPHISSRPVPPSPRLQWFVRALDSQPKRCLQITPPLSQFGYGDVELLEGPIREQFDRNHAFYLALDEDSLLKPFRQRAGLPAPGEDMGGWYSWAPLSDLDASPATTALLPATASANISPALRAIMPPPATKPRRRRCIVSCTDFAPAITPHFWDDNRFPAYTYDKISIGMIDAHEFAGDPQAFKALDATLDSVTTHLPPGLSRAEQIRAAAQATNPSAGTSPTRCLKISSLPGSAARAAVTRIWACVSSPTTGIGIRSQRAKTYSPASTPTATSTP